jgi:hypothetical protein
LIYKWRIIRTDQLDYDEEGREIPASNEVCIDLLMVGGAVIHGEDGDSVLSQSDIAWLICAGIASTNKWCLDNVRIDFEHDGVSDPPERF